MALIECPECKGKVSDQAAACPHCGNPAIHNPLRIACPECDAQIMGNPDTCPNCGFPTQQKVSHPNPATATPSPPSEIPVQSAAPTPIKLILPEANPEPQLPQPKSAPHPEPQHPHPAASTADNMPTNYMLGHNKQITGPYNLDDIQAWLDGGMIHARTPCMAQGDVHWSTVAGVLGISVANLKSPTLNQNKIPVGFQFGNILAGIITLCPIAISGIIGFSLFAGAIEGITKNTTFVGITVTALSAFTFLALLIWQITGLLCLLGGTWKTDETSHKSMAQGAGYIAIINLLVIFLIFISTKFVPINEQYHPSNLIISAPMALSTVYLLFISYLWKGWERKQ